MMVDSDILQSMYRVSCDGRRWRVVMPMRTQLQPGDEVVAVHGPDHRNYLLRTADMTLHALCDEDGQYIIVIEQGTGSMNAS